MASRYGFELSADWDVTRTLRVGGNYTYIERDFDYQKAAREFEPFGTAVRQLAAEVGSIAAYASRGHADPQGVPLRLLAGDAAVDA